MGIVKYVHCCQFTQGQLDEPWTVYKSQVFSSVLMRNWLETSFYKLLKPTKYPFEWFIKCF